MSRHQQKRLHRTVLVIGLVGCFFGFMPTESLASDRYAKQKQEMNEYIYPLYRMLERFMQTNKFSQGIAITSRAKGSRACEADRVCKLASEIPRVSKEDNLLIWALQTINDVWDEGQLCLFGA